MAKTNAHKHQYDILPPDPKFLTPRVACTVCGFSVPLSMLASRTNLDSIVARENATQTVRDLLNRDCGECGGSGELTQLGGDWGKTPDRQVACWKCKGTGKEPR